MLRQRRRVGRRQPPEALGVHERRDLKDFHGRKPRGGATNRALRARERGMDVVPNCAYVIAWIKRHPAYADLVRAGS